MDNNNQAQTIQQPEPEAANKKPIMWLILGIIIVILIIGGAYWYVGKQSKSEMQSKQPAGQTTASSDNLDQDLSSIDVQASEGDFDALDRDLQSL